jgi:hypothetical protein
MILKSMILYHILNVIPLRKIVVVPATSKRHRANIKRQNRVHWDMQSEAQLNPETVERLEEQSRLLLRTYELEMAKDPASRATKSARSNLIALRHTINQIYGESAALDVTEGLEFATILVSGEE